MNKKLLIMKNFPKNIIDIKWNEMPLVNPGKVIRTSELIMGEPMTLFLYKDGGVMVDKLIEEGKGITSFRAVNYSEFFSENFSEGAYTVLSDVLYIYNIGTELSNSSEFSDKVLHKLVQHNKAAGNTTILTSDYYNGSTFGTRYSMTDQLIDSKMQVLK